MDRFTPTRRLASFSFTGLACLVLLLTPASGQSQTTSASILAANPDSALAATLAALSGEPLELAQALAAAGTAATAAQLAEADLAAAQAALRRERGGFDPELFGRGSWTGNDVPGSSPFTGAEVLETVTADLEAGARITLPIGTELSAALSTLRTTSNSSLAALSPQYETFGTLTLRQPLLKGFGPSSRGERDATARDLAAARARRQAAGLAVGAEVETAYWQLYAAERDFAVAQLIRDRAVAFRQQARLRAEAGLVGPSEVASADVFLAQQEQLLLDAEEQLDLLSDRLASLIGRRPAHTPARFRATDEPPRVFALLPADSLVTAGLARNPELRALDELRRAAAVRARAAERDALPTLDLFGALGGNGLSGTVRDVVFPGTTDTLRVDVADGFGPGWAQVRDRAYPYWNVGFVFALPLGGRADGGERDRVRAEADRAALQLEGARRLYEEQVRAQQRELARGNRRLELAAAGVYASIRQVQIGQIEYANGRSTAFEVVRLAADLAGAQQRYSQALVRTARAAAALRQLTGGWYTSDPQQEQRP